MILHTLTLKAAVKLHHLILADKLEMGSTYLNVIYPILRLRLYENNWGWGRAMGGVFGGTTKFIL